MLIYLGDHFILKQQQLGVFVHHYQGLAMVRQKNGEKQTRKPGKWQTKSKATTTRAKTAIPTPTAPRAQ